MAKINHSINILDMVLISLVITKAPHRERAWFKFLHGEVPDLHRVPDFGRIKVPVVPYAGRTTSEISAHIARRRSCSAASWACAFGSLGFR